MEQRSSATLSEDECYMHRAVELAWRGLGRVAPNPMVGAVIVAEGRIIGEGWHECFGEAHAEVNALRAVVEADKKLLPQATLYVTLEPCAHWGKTPPCADAILQHKIGRVVVAVLDINPLTAGKGIAKLQAAGVAVSLGVLAAAGAALLRRFVTVLQEQRPYVLLKFALSQEGNLGLPDKSVWLSNPLSRRLVHRWRSQEAAILVGANTASLDNPQLNNRYWGSQQPTRIVLDGNSNLPAALRLFDGKQPTLWITDESGETRNGAERIVVPQGEDFPLRLLKRLHQLGITSILIEGGAATISMFWAAGLWDEARIIHTPTPLPEGLPFTHDLTRHEFKGEFRLLDNKIGVYWRGSSQALPTQAVANRQE